MQRLIDATDKFTLAYHLENTPFGIILWNHDVHVQYCSIRAAEIFGWDPDEVVRRSIELESFVHEDDLDQVRKTITALVKGSESRNHMTNRNLTVGGATRYCAWYNSTLRKEDGTLANLLSLVLDVTEQKEQENELRQMEEELSLIYNSAIDPMWLIDIEENDRYVFRSINKSFTQVTGLETKQVLGHTIEEVLPDTSHGLVRAKYKEARDTRKIVDYFEKATHVTGVKYGEIRVVPICDDEGVVTKLVGIANDVTDRMTLAAKLDEERENKNKQITAAMIKSQEDERARVGRELHDNVNQVLTTVKLYVELAADGKVDARDVLLKCSRFLQQSIDEIRSLSKQLSAPTLGNISFYDSLGELVASINQTKKVTIELKFSLSSCSTMDPNLHLSLYRIVQEQLTNILKYAHANQVVVRLEEAAGTLALMVIDDGIGFDMNAAYTGIGITNMRSRVNLLDGVFQLQSDFGLGTTLTARFPVIIEHGHCRPRLQNAQM